MLLRRKERFHEQQEHAYQAIECNNHLRCADHSVWGPRNPASSRHRSSCCDASPSHKHRATEAPATEAAGKMYDGVTIDILTFVGPQVAEPLQRRGPDFTALTGATVNIITVPNSELYQKVLTDAVSGTNAYDGYLFAPAWIVDFAPAGLIEDLTPYVRRISDLEWDDVAPFFRDFNSYNGKVYSIPSGWRYAHGLLSN